MNIGTALTSQKIVKVWYTTRQISTLVVYNDDLIETITLREGFRIIPQKAVNIGTALTSQKIVNVGYFTQLDRSLYSNFRSI